MRELKKLLKKITKFLNSVKGEDRIRGFCLIGGMGIGARGIPRATKDIDLFINADEDYFQKDLPKELKKAGYSLKVYKGDRDDPLRNLIRILDEKGNFLVDLILIHWNWQEEIINSAEPIQFEPNLFIPIAKAEDLIVLKLKAGSLRDLLDAEELLRIMIMSKQFDKDRLYLLSKRAGIDKKLHSLLSKIK